MAKYMIFRGISIRQAVKEVNVKEVIIKHHLKADKDGTSVSYKGIPTAIPEICEKELNMMLAMKSK